MQVRLRMLSVAACLVCICVGARPQNTQWKAYSYTTDGFSAEFPSEPAIETQSVPITEAIKFDLRTYLVDSGSDGMMIGVSHFGLLVEGKDPDVLLQSGKQGALQNTQTHLVKEKKIKLGDNPGLEFEAENDSLHAVVRIYLANNTLYEVLVACPVGKPAEWTNRFLDSFRVLAAVPLKPAQ